MARIRICKEEGCHNSATTEGYCRLHYLRNWKRLRDEKRKRQAKRLNRYIEGVMREHPDRYVEIIKKELRSPDFVRSVDEAAGAERSEELLFDDATYDEEVDELIRGLKIEKGF